MALIPLMAPLNISYTTYRANHRVRSWSWSGEIRKDFLKLGVVKCLLKNKLQKDIGLCVGHGYSHIRAERQER